MNTTMVFALLEKGLRLMPLLIAAGADIVTLVERLGNLAKAGADGKVTDEELAALEADLDAKLAEFNAPLPPD